MIQSTRKEMGTVLFGKMPDDFSLEFQPDVYVGDLLEIKESMMLIEPDGPVLVLEADNTMGLYEIMYLRNNYIINCSRMDIRKKISEIR